MNKLKPLVENLIWALVFICLAIIGILASANIMFYIVLGIGIIWAIYNAILVWKEMRNQRGR